MSEDNLILITFNNQLKNELKSEILYDNEIKFEKFKQEVNEKINKMEQNIRNELFEEYENYKFKEINNIINSIGIILITYTFFKK